MDLVQIVHDDPHFIFLVEDYLVQQGYKVISTEDSQSGWQQYQKYQPKIVISDGSMSLENGYQFLAKVKTVNPRQHFIMLWDPTDLPDYCLKTLEFSIDSWLPKPFEPKDLLERIRFCFSGACPDLIGG